MRWKKEHADKAAEPTGCLNLPSGYWETDCECSGMCITLGERCESVTTGNAQTGQWQIGP